MAHTFFLLGDYERTLEWYSAGRSLLSGPGSPGRGRAGGRSHRVAAPPQCSGRAVSGHDRVSPFLPPGRPCQEYRDPEAGTGSAADQGPGSQVLPGAAVGPRRRACGGVAGPYATWWQRGFSARLPCDAIRGCGRFPGCRTSRTSWMRFSGARRTPERPSRRQAEIGFWRNRCRVSPPSLDRSLDARTSRLPMGQFRCSTHALGVAEAIELARALDRLPRKLIVFGIEGIRLRPRRAPVRGSYGSGRTPGPALDLSACKMSNRVCPGGARGFACLAFGFKQRFRKFRLPYDAPQRATSQRVVKRNRNG